MFMKIFVYHVGNYDFADTVPFGDAWKKAKEKATEMKECIYRTVIEERREVYVEAGAFMGIDDAPAIKFFGE